MTSKQKKQLKQFVKERDEALLSLDREKILAFIKRWNPAMHDGFKNASELVFWATVYKCICNITSAPDEAKIEAMEWLREHNMSTEVL